MADNLTVDGNVYSTEEVTNLNGGAVSAQHLQRLAAAIRTADGTAIDLPGDAANGLDVDVTRLPALAAGTNTIGKLGANSGVDIGDVTINNASIPITIADGDSAALGAKADAAASSDTGTFSLIALFKRLLSKLTTQLPAALTGSGNLKVSIAESTATQTVSGTVATTSAAASEADGHSASIGATGDADTATTVIGRLKKLVALIAGGLPAALTAGGNLKISLQESNASQTVTGTVATTAAAASQADGHSAAIGSTTDAAATGNGTLIAIQKQVRALLAGGLPAALGGLGGLKVEPQEPATFLVVYDAIVPAVNKYMAVLFNTSTTRKVVVHRIWAQQWTITAATGVTNELQLRRITARAVGTAVAPLASDSNDTLNASITASHADTSVTDGSLIRRFFISSEEAKAAAALAFNSDTQSQMDWFGIDGHLVWSKKDGVKGIVLRQNQGIAIKNITGAAGALSFIIEFTEEPA